MIHTSPYPDVVIPDVTLPDFVMANAHRLGAKPALVDGISGRTVSHAEFADQVVRTSVGLVRRGFAKGDVFAICMPNSIEYPIAFHAVARAGGIVTPINSISTVDEVRKQLSDSGARFVLTCREMAEKIASAAQGTRVEEIFTTSDAPGTTPFVTLLDSSAEIAMPAIDPREDVVALPYSSGTTGLCKGVMLTHRNLVANLIQLDVGHMRESDVLVCVLPMFHIYGLTAIVNFSLRRGCTAVTLPRFDLAELIDVLEKRRVTFAHLVPPILLAIAKNPLFSGRDLSHLRVVFSGAAPLSAELSRECAERLGCAVVQGYGMTESSPATHMTPMQPGTSKHGSIGVCLPNTECRIVDTATGRDLAFDEPGELWVRGPQVMKGYLNQPEATRATVDAEGWLHTGDVGYVDRDGQFFIVDRVKELIKYKAWQVAPAELEALLATHPCVADVAVIGAPDAEAGEIPKAFVVLRGAATADELMRFVAERVAPYKKVRAVQFVDSIPKSASGKILRRVLVERERLRE